MIYNQNEIISCVVVDCIYKKDPEFLGEIISKFSENTGEEAPFNSRYLFKSPPGSIIAKTQNPSTYMVLYPFFSSHISLPVKPGEHVWAFFPGGAGSNNIGYWMTRRVTDEYIEDLNYTNNTRAVYNIYENLVKADPNAQSLSRYYNSEGVGFKNYRSLINNSASSPEMVFESIERAPKKPSDLVLQGSNNSQMFFTCGNKKRTGTIIMTTGRGSSSTTAASIVKNSIQKEENNKASDLTNLGSKNENEGKVDVENDRSIFVVSENPEFLNDIIDTSEDFEKFDEMSHIFAKSDRIRMEARETINSTGVSINLTGENNVNIVSPTVNVRTTGWSVEMKMFFDIVEKTLQELSKIASGAAPLATGVGPTGPSTNVAEVQKLLADIQSMKE